MPSSKTMRVENSVNQGMYDCIAAPEDTGNGEKDDDTGEMLKESSGFSRKNGGCSSNMQSFEVSQAGCGNEGGESPRPSNENLLGTAFCTFMSFALIQTVVAIFAKSEAMLGDSAAMIVDALTYLFNWIAEHKKNQFDQKHSALNSAMIPYSDDNNPQSIQSSRRVLQRDKRKMVLQLELIPPLVSVSTLLVVTAVVLYNAIRVLILDTHRSVALQGNPNIEIMMGFSIANLLLDLVNVFNFAKAKHLLGYETSEPPPSTRVSHATENCEQSGDITQDDGPAEFQDEKIERGSDDDEGDDEVHRANLNMCSAYTHVFADTLRSIAVLAASTISEFVEKVTAEEADAAAAVMVSGLIILSLIPLLSGLVHTVRELQSIRAEERSEQLIMQQLAT